MTRMKYKERMKIDRDKRQIKLEPQEKQMIKQRKQLITISKQKGNEIVTCPFCLHISKLYDFVVQTKKGDSLLNAKCPDCNKGMRMTSLTKSMTIEEFADWIFEYGLRNYWQRVSWQKWHKRLYQLGWSYSFWKKYKELKIEYGSESYEDHIMRQQQEQAEEEGWIEE